MTPDVLEVAPMRADWTRDDCAAALGLADALEIDPLDLLAIWYSESGLDAHRRGGLAAMTPIVEVELGWRVGTIGQVVAGPILGQIGALSAYYGHVLRRYARRPLAATARAWGVPPAVVLYAFSGWPSVAMRSSGLDSVLASSGPGYSGNAYVDADRSGAITVADVAARVATSRARMLADARGAAVASTVRELARVPRSARPSLGALLAPIAPALARLLG